MKMNDLGHFPDTLRSTGLFRGIEDAELRTMLTCMGAMIKKVRKGKIILLTGERPESIGIVVSGLLQIIKEDYNGNRSIVAALTSGEIFAEALCCAGICESPVTVVAAANSTIMLLKFSRVLHTCPKPCSFHSKLIKNLLGLVANKNLFLQERMEIIRLKSVRAKVMLYLESFAQKRGKEIVIPFNREEMADFLNVERSALSHELAKMKKDGLVDYWKNRFIIR